MFFTYLRRELRRRMRQASMIAVGLALGIGLVITVTALSAGVKNAQGEVLHSLYGVGTDITVTKAPAAGSGGPRRSGSAARPGTAHRGKARAPRSTSTTWPAAALGTISTSAVTTIARLHNVAAAAGGLTLTDTKITGQDPGVQLHGRERRRVPAAAARRAAGGGGTFARVLQRRAPFTRLRRRPVPRARSARSARASSPPAGPSPRPTPPPTSPSWTPATPRRTS